MKIGWDVLENNAKNCVYKCIQNKNFSKENKENINTENKLKSSYKIPSVNQMFPFSHKNTYKLPGDSFDNPMEVN